ncbi:activating signal cointegrator 1 isoform X1 [Microplitis mediator]|uniref:activating signal cointegrator 1 isoform X1 n=1 Tax=Microplitis mediator TaxID=375433 RepID=UPI0025561C5C|nr:activating signal cointegrator 1 isoform X1 [Microplitis mediator]
MDRWVHDNLSLLLDFPVPEDLTQYILQIHNERDLDDYLQTLLDFSNPKHRNFVLELKRKRGAENHLTGYKKVDDNFSNPNGQPQKQSDKKKNKTKDKEEKEILSEKNVKKKSKFVSIFSDDGKDKFTIMLKNRHKCDCEAKSHSLINNCLNCGRIVCAQEGSGPCFYCNELVCTPDQQSILAMQTKQSDHLYNKLMDQKIAKDQMQQQAALQQRDKLVEFDRNSVKRTQVIDDQSDYYQSSDSVWLSNKERAEIQKHQEELRNLKHASRFTKKVTLDLYGRQIIDEPDDYDILSLPNQEYAENTNDICPDFEFDLPQYIETSNKFKNSSVNPNASATIRRIQDKELLDMVDEGYCLSMHQPYASLLVAGIKTHEGRTWYSAHRGRLWIHAAAKAVSKEEITSLENHYRHLSENLKFPKSYPTGCLLGCVTVVDVLAQDEYRKIYPDGDSDSPYVFICQDTHELSLKFPMQGKNKIYKLDKQIHKAALKHLT